ncbi:hypothetical protein [Actinoallomurus sp. CA-142502]|uniref:hypothetical protein n=1 Tax=Actinoallomurus sp. CA-142502 TaxID=3239885 RepID=UPI003D932DC8
MTDRTEPRPFAELTDSGLLWLINRVVFHPRGLALAIHVDGNGTATAWSLQGDGTEPWSFPPEREREHFQHAEQTLRDAADRGGE